MSETSVPIPQWTPNARELDDLDIVVGGVLAPRVTGFVGPGGPWPIHLTLPTGDAAAASGVGQLDLLDPEGVPLARMSIESSYPVGDDRTGLVGPLEPLAHNEFGPFRHLHRRPTDLHAERARDTLVAVPLRGPVDNASIDRVRSVARSSGRTPVLLALVGEGMPDRTSGPGLMRMTLAAATALADVDAQVVAVSLADHGAASDALVEAVATAYSDEVLHLEASTDGDLPAEVAVIVAHERPPRAEQGVVVFFTGLSGSGKSTLARALLDRILERGDRTVTSLDGDVVRHHLSKGLGFSRADRETNILRIGFVAAEIARHGGIAICSPIAPFDGTRSAVRKMVERTGGGFLLIHVATPLEECERRDRKGLYAKARRGEIPDFTGISSPYEEPVDYFLKVDTTDRDIAECLEELAQALVADGWLRA